MSNLLTRQEVAKRLNVSISTFDRMRDDNDLPDHVQISPNRIGWREEDIDAFVVTRQGERYAPAAAAPLDAGTLRALANSISKHMNVESIQVIKKLDSIKAAIDVRNTETPVFKLDVVQMGELKDHISDEVERMMPGKRPICIWMPERPEDPNTEPFAIIRISGASARDTVELKFASAIDLLTCKPLLPQLRQDQRLMTSLLEAVAAQEAKRLGKPAPTEDQTRRMIEAATSKR